MIDNKASLPKLPYGWIWSNLEEVSANDKNAIVDGPFGSNLKLSDYIDDESGIPVLSTKNFEHGYERKYLRFISHSKFKELKRSEVKGGDILVAKIGSCGKTSVYPEDMSSAMIPANLLKMTVHPIIKKMFVYYFLNSPFFKKQLEDIITATAQPAFNITKFRKLYIPLSPINEQERIVLKIEELLTKLDAGIEALKKIKELVKRFRQAVLKYAFEGKFTEEWRETNKGELTPVSSLLERIKNEKQMNTKIKFRELPSIDASNLFSLPEGWMWIRVGDLVSRPVTKGSTPTSYGYSFKDKGIKFIKTENIGDDGSISNISHFLDDETNVFLKRSVLELNDMLFSIAGTIGRVGVVQEKNLPANTNQALAIIRCSWKNIDNKYLFYFLKSPFIQKQAIDSIVGVGRANISLTNVSEFLFPFASLEEQNKIVEEIERHFSVADEIEKALELTLKQSERLLQSILKRAFEGKLVPQDPSDEPASTLFERIKAEKVSFRDKEKMKKKKEIVTKQGRLF